MNLDWVFLWYPVLVAVFSLAGTLKLRKWFIMPILTLVVFLVVTFVVYNDSFLIWTAAYTVLAALVSWITAKLSQGNSTAA